MKTPSSIMRTSQPPPYERWWRCLFNESEDAQLVYASDGTIQEANRTAIRMLGLSGKEDSLPNLYQMLTSTAAARVAALLQQHVGSQVTLPAVALMVEGQISLLADLQITPLGQGFSLVTIRDATRRWRMESHVQRLVTAMDATPDVVFLTDVEFRLVFVNPSFLRDTGYSIEEALGRPADFLRAAGQEAQWQACREQVRAGREWQGEFVNVRNDGSTYLASVSLAPIFDRKGGFLGCVSFERDITQMRRVQQELQRESAFTRSILNSLDAALYATDTQFRLLHFNEGWKRLPPDHGGLRWSRPPRVGDSLLESVTDAQRQAELRRCFQEVLQTGNSCQFRWAGAEGRHWFVRICPWRVQDQVEGLLYLVTDQTSLHQLLEQFAQAEKVEMTRALTAGVAHGFNEFLQAMSRELEAFPQAAAPETQARFQRMQAAVAQALTLAQQLSALSRPLCEPEAPVDFNVILQEAAQIFQRIHGRQVECRVMPAALPLPVRMERVRAHQLLLILCVNALKAMPQGGTLTLTNTPITLSDAQASKAAARAADGWMRCTVRDTGCGMAPEHLAHIFEPFYTTHTAGQGARWDLAIVQNIMHQAGGFIEVETEPGRGTTFYLYLPLQRCPAWTAAPAASEAFCQTPSL
ncbi:MAG: PAS domain S-box protein [Verrucomicrobiae bacterium]|nr:PAS domain S-box protein [Verrucomicrobiae bacterium]